MGGDEVDEVDEVAVDEVAAASGDQAVEQRRASPCWPRDANRLRRTGGRGVRAWVYSRRGLAHEGAVIGRGSVGASFTHHGLRESSPYDVARWVLRRRRAEAVEALGREAVEAGEAVLAWMAGRSADDWAPRGGQ